MGGTVRTSRRETRLEELGAIECGDIERLRWEGAPCAGDALLGAQGVGDLAFVQRGGEVVAI